MLTFFGLGAMAYVVFAESWVDRGASAIDPDLLPQPAEVRATDRQPVSSGADTLEPPDEESEGPDVKPWHAAYDLGHEETYVAKYLRIVALNPRYAPTYEAFERLLSECAVAYDAQAAWENVEPVWEEFQQLRVAQLAWVELARKYETGVDEVGIEHVSSVARPFPARDRMDELREIIMAAVTQTAYEH